MRNVPDFRRISGGSFAIWGGSLAVALLVASIAGGALDLGVSNTPTVRIDSPSE